MQTQIYLKSRILKYLIPLLILSSVLLFNNFKTTNRTSVDSEVKNKLEGSDINNSIVNSTKKINGLSLEAPSKAFEADFFNEFLEVNSNWVCIMPYAFTKKNSPNMRHGNISWQWWGETIKGSEECIEMAASKSIQSMLKPHLWIHNGDFTGDFDLDEKKWKTWEKDYKDYILTYARMAEKFNAPILCIGTELKTFVNKRPDFWKQLIEETREVYSGKLTYAGNWDSYKSFPHWELLDYIGVDAYFPLSDSKTPTTDEMIAGWQPWKKELKAISEKYDRPILFTEFGYCSMEYCAKEPWTFHDNNEVSQEAQKNAYEATFESFWNEDWFAGGFLWKWHAKGHNDVERLTKRFTPQGKSSLEVLKENYK